MPALFAPGWNAQQPRRLFGQTASAVRRIRSGPRRLQNRDHALSRRQRTDAAVDGNRAIETFRSHAAAYAQIFTRPNCRSLRPLRIASRRRSESRDPAMKLNLSQ